MLAVAVPEGVHTNCKCDEDHQVFQRNVFNDVYAKYRQAGEQQGQNGTMNGARYRGSNAQGVPVKPEIHAAKIREFLICN